MFRLIAFLALLPLAATWPAPAQARCDLALIFAVDSSASVDGPDYDVQLSGVAEGLRDPMVADALARAGAALMVVEWSGHDRQRVLLGWHRMATVAHVGLFADEIARLNRVSDGQATAIGEALAFSAAAFDGAPDCRRRVIDISGDGVSNEGRLPRFLRARLAARGITVNALVIDTPDQSLTEYFLDNVVSGRDGFAITALGVTDFAGKMRLKLYRELAIQLARAE